MILEGENVNSMRYMTRETLRGVIVCYRDIIMK